MRQVVAGVDTAPQLEVRDLSLSFTQDLRRVCVFEHLSFDVEAGEFVSVIGPSGCGKSSLLLAIAGLPPAYPPTSGGIFIDGAPVVGPGRNRVMVFQEYAVYPWLTVRGNVEFPLEVAGLPKKERQARTAHYLEMVGLVDSQNAYPHQLSGGMKQRVAIARSLTMKPRVLLMDEPFAAVDALTRLELQRELLNIWEIEKCTVMFVTHNVEEAIYLGTRLMVCSAAPIRLLLDENLANDRDSRDVIGLRSRVGRLLGVEAQGPAGR